MLFPIHVAAPVAMVALPRPPAEGAGPSAVLLWRRAGGPAMWPLKLSCERARVRMACVRAGANRVLGGMPRLDPSDGNLWKYHAMR